MAISELEYIRAAVLPVTVSWLLTYAIHSTLLLGLIWLITLYVRSHRLKDLLWKTALVGGVLTATFQVFWGLKPLTGQLDLLSSSEPVRLSQVQGEITPETVTAAHSASEASLDRGWELTRSPSSVMPGTGAGEQVRERAIRITMLLRDYLASVLRSGGGWLFGLWLVGAAAAGLRFGLATRRLYASLGHRRDIADGPLADVFARLRLVAGVRSRVRLTCSSRVSSPMALNAREICIPSELVAGLSAEQQESLLAHELAHVVRHDPTWLVVIGVLQSLFFFQPLIRLARRRMQECAEYLCDDLAACYTGGSLVLARCLVKVAGWHGLHAQPVAVAGMAWSTSMLEQRVRRLLDDVWTTSVEAPRRWWTCLIVGVLVIVGCAGPGVSVNTGSTEKPPHSVGDTWSRPADEMVMVYVPGGEFEMGGTEWGNEQPVHTVALDSFWIDQTEVTNEQYQQCVEAGVCDSPARSGSATRGSYYDDSAYDDHPVIWVDWQQAGSYCEWAGARLPTEAEWEYAARGPEGRLFPWGDEFDGARLNYCDTQCNNFWADEAVGDGYADTAPVGSFPRGASWCGALDMAGNVLEWVADWYEYEESPPRQQVNPTGPSSGEARIMRGGSWDSPDIAVRSAFRYWEHPNTPYYSLGFRCAGDSQ
ncbi:MAG: SUMF1/EgtB/PvdO family nonheme iron enzyme [Chloroflexota bacterium]|nr:SUMF1/EgtB/PvdO family nonheme iron enzyme [Chloroflexota bacterium]